METLESESYKKSSYNTEIKHLSKNSKTKSDYENLKVGITKPPTFPTKVFSARKTECSTNGKITPRNTRVNITSKQ
jgi:hypothetical protein